MSILFTSVRDRNVADAADLQQLTRLGFNALRGIDDHDRAVGGRERPVGVF